MNFDEAKNKIVRFVKSSLGLIIGVTLFFLFALNFQEYYRIGQLFLMLALGGFTYHLVDDHYFKDFDTMTELKNGNVAIGLFVLGLFIYLSVCIIAIHL